MDEAFRHAIRPSLPLVLKLRLAPFTLSHWFLLARWCPEFIDPESRDDCNLPLAALICSLPPRQAEKVITRRWLRLFFWLWGWRCRKLNMGSELDKFLEYLRAAMQGPNCARHPDREARTSNAPTGFWLHGMLMAEFGMDYQTALHTGTAEALCLYAARQESLGKVELVSARSRRLCDFIRQKRQAAPVTSSN